MILNKSQLNVLFYSKEIQIRSEAFNSYINNYLSATIQFIFCNLI